MCHIANYSNCIILMAFNIDTKSIIQKVKEGDTSEFNQCSLLYAFFTKLHSNGTRKEEHTSIYDLICSLKIASYSRTNVIHRKFHTPIRCY